MSDYVLRWSPKKSRYIRVKRPEINDSCPKADWWQDFRLQIHESTMKNYRSVMKLHKLRFDPIEALVRNYTAVQAEIDIYEGMRANKIQFINHDGKVRYYDQAVHMGLFKQLTDIAKELLKYGYSAMPQETNINHSVKPVMNVTLTTTNEEYLIGNENADAEALAALSPPEEVPEE
jgi:hypothetical protein